MELAGALTSSAGTDQYPDPSAPGMVGGEDDGGSQAPDRNLRAWTPGRQRRALLELLRAGQTDVQIGERFALSQWQVRNLRYRLGIKKDRGGRVRVRGSARRTAQLEREFVETAARVVDEPAPMPSTERLPARAALEAERMGVRVAGRFDAAEAGRRLTAIGGLLAASEGRYEIRVGIRQIEATGAP